MAHHHIGSGGKTLHASRVDSIQTTVPGSLHLDKADRRQGGEVVANCRLADRQRSGQVADRHWVWLPREVGHQLNPGGIGERPKPRRVHLCFIPGHQSLHRSSTIVDDLASSTFECAEQVLVGKRVAIVMDIGRCLTTPWIRRRDPRVTPLRSS
jgi:hypothetical protein